MNRTIEALTRRRKRCKAANFSICRVWPWALVLVNVLLLAVFLLDGPVVSYARNNALLLKPIGSTITDFGDSGWIIITTLVICIEAVVAYRLSPTLRGRFQAAFVGHMAAYVFVCVTFSGLLANLLKRLIGRARPTLYDEFGILGFKTLAGSSRFESFPSGHATTIGAFMMAMALIAPPYRLLFLVMGLWLGFSRVIVGAHYPSDVIAGLALGAWFSLFTAILFARHGLLFNQKPDGLPVLRRAVPLSLLPPDLAYQKARMPYCPSLSLPRQKDEGPALAAPGPGIFVAVRKTAVRYLRQSALISRSLVSGRKIRPMTRVIVAKTIGYQRP
jgi:undecaprenyl-diphosphatase